MLLVSSLLKWPVLCVGSWWFSADWCSASGAKRTAAFAKAEHEVWPAGLAGLCQRGAWNIQNFKVRQSLKKQRCCNIVQLKSVKTLCSVLVLFCGCFAEHLFSARVPCALTALFVPKLSGNVGKARDHQRAEGRVDKDTQFCVLFVPQYSGTAECFYWVDKGTILDVLKMCCPSWASNFQSYLVLQQSTVLICRQWTPL